jgi:ketosteroid isomerase-like protein
MAPNPDSSSGPEAALSLVREFNEALNRADVEGMMARMTADCIFENTYPAPDGDRLEGQAEVRRFWEAFFRTSLEPRIEIEEIFAGQDRCVMRWIYHWSETSGERPHIRGVDLYRIRAGKIAEKLSYVKG